MTYYLRISYTHVICFDQIHPLPPPLSSNFSLIPNPFQTHSFSWKGNSCLQASRGLSSSAEGEGSDPRCPLQVRICMADFGFCQVCSSESIPASSSWPCRQPWMSMLVGGDKYHRPMTCHLWSSTVSSPVLGVQDTRHSDMKCGHTCLTQHGREGSGRHEIQLEKGNTDLF